LEHLHKKYEGTEY